MKKVIFIDWSFFLHQSLFSCQRRGQLTLAPFQCVKSILACLKKISLTADDFIIFALDSPLGSWRKNVDANYKAQREQAKKNSGIDWAYYYVEFNILLKNLMESTPFFKVEVDYLEADDIISIGTRHFDLCEVIIISSDSDFDQLTVYSHVKILNPKTKVYKIINKPYESLNKKIRGDRSDNLLKAPKTKNELKLRHTIVNLLTLPDHIEEAGKKAFDELKLKYYNWDNIIFPNLKTDLQNIYCNENKKIINYDDSFKKKRKKKDVELISIL